MKKVLAFILSFVTVISVFATVCAPTASATLFVNESRLVKQGNYTYFYTDGQFDSDYTGAVCVNGEYYYVENGVVNEKLSKYVDAVMMAIKQGKKQANVYSAKLDYNKYKSTLSNIAYDDLYTEINAEYCIEYISYILKGNYIDKVEIVYNESIDDIDLHISQAEAIRRILYGIENNNAMSDAIKALRIHDRLVLWAQYDADNYVSGVEHIPLISYTPQGILGNQIGVCQGYAEAYEYLLKRVGIDNYLCDSDALWHVWNIVYINGKKYHVDVTWDDPLYNDPKKVYRNNFLISTSKLRSTGHNAYDYDSSPTDTTYDYYSWPSAETTVPLLPVYLLKKDGDWILIDGYYKKVVDTFYELEDRIYYIDDGRVATEKTGVFTADGKTYYVKNGVVDFNANGFYASGDSGYYLRDGTLFDCTGLVKNTKTGKYCYVKNGIWQKDSTGVIKHTNGDYCYVKNGIWQQNFSGLGMHINGEYCYIKKGLWQRKYTGVVKHTNGNYYYVKNGIRQYSNGVFAGTNAYYYIENGVRKNVNGLRKSNGKYYYFKNGIADYTGLLKLNGKYYHFKNGLRQYTTGLIKHNGTLYYVKNGIFTNSTGIAKYGSNSYYVQNGVRSNITGFVKNKGKYYYVKNGIVQTNYKGLVKSNGKWYYVVGGVRQYTTQFAKHTDGKQYYVNNGIFRDVTGFVKIGDQRYYAKKGIRQTGTGFVKEGNKYYYVKKGVLQTSTGFVKVNGKTYYIVKGVFQNTTSFVKSGGKYYFVKNGILIFNATRAISLADRDGMSRSNLLGATNDIYNAIMNGKGSLNVSKYKLPAGTDGNNVTEEIISKIFELDGIKCTEARWWYSGNYTSTIYFYY